MVTKGNQTTTSTYFDGLVCHEYVQPTKKELFLTCACEADILKIEKWSDDEDVFLTVFSYQSLRYSFWERLIFLFGGKTKTSSIILDKKQFNKLKKF